MGLGEGLDYGVAVPFSDQLRKQHGQDITCVPFTLAPFPLFSLCRLAGLIDVTKNLRMDMSSAQANMVLSISLYAWCSVEQRHCFADGRISRACPRLFDRVPGEDRRRDRMLHGRLSSCHYVGKQSYMLPFHAQYSDAAAHCTLPFRTDALNAEPIHN